MNKWKVVFATSYEVTADDSNEAIDKARELLDTELRTIGDIFGENVELIEETEQEIDERAELIKKTTYPDPLSSYEDASSGERKAEELAERERRYWENRHLVTGEELW
jgi:hypothetical protein